MNKCATPEIYAAAVTEAVADLILTRPNVPVSRLMEKISQADKDAIEAQVRKFVKTEVSSDKFVKAALKSKDAEKIVTTITAQALARFFEIMFTRRGTWQSQLKL